VVGAGGFAVEAVLLLPPHPASNIREARMTPVATGNVEVL